MKQNNSFLRLTQPKIQQPSMCTYDSCPAVVTVTIQTIAPAARPHQLALCAEDFEALRRFLGAQRALASERPIELIHEQSDRLAA